MLYYKAGRSEKFRYALRLDGVNDYLNSGSYTQWERTQAFTMQFFLQDRTVNGWLFDNRKVAQLSNDDFRGISVGFIGGNFIFQINHSQTNKANHTVSANPNWVCFCVAVVWDGSTSFLYADGNDVGGTKTNALSGTILNTLNYFRLFGRADLSTGTLLPTGAKLKNFSVVNYAKSALEIASDYAAGFQSQGSGLYLLNYDFNIKPANQGLIVQSVGGAGPDLNIVGQTTPDFVKL